MTIPAGPSNAPLAFEGRSHYCQRGHAGGVLAVCGTKRGRTLRRSGEKAWRLALVGACMMSFVGIAGGSVLVPRADAASPAVSVEVVVENPDYEVLAVDSSGITYGKSTTDEHGIWRSLDEGQTWTKVLTLPSNQRVVYISALASGTLLAHVDTGALTLYRSANHGDTWTSVLVMQPNASIFYTTLTPNSITDGGGYVWLGSYNTGPSPPYPNYIYRSADDGQTWSIVNTTLTHRHIHGVRYNNANGKLYVFFGDSDGADGTWVSSDNGLTLQPLCTDYACITVDGAFDPAGTFLLFGQDNYTLQNHIAKVSLATGALTLVMPIPYDSFSAYRLVGDTYLVGTTHEGGVPVVDPNLHLYASIDGGATFTDVFQVPLPYTDFRADLQVQFSYPNGDFPIQIDGHGTTIARLVTGGTDPTPPSNSGLPVVSGVAQVGQSLVGTVGSWSGSAPIGYGEQWLRCNAAGGACVSIGLATGLSYSPVALDVGSTLRLRVSASNGVGGPVTADSAATAVVGAASVVGVSDSFDRADAAALGGSWSATTRYGASSCLLAISGNQAAYPVGRTGTCDQYWLGDSAQADGVASFTVTALPSDGGEFDIQGRMQALGTTSAVIYEAGWVRNTTGLDQYSLYRRTAAGAWIQIVTTTGPDVAVGDQLAFKIQGSTLSVYHRPLSTGTWNQVLTTTDTTISGAGRFGIELYNATNGKLDNWTISTDLPGSSPPVPTPPSNSGLPVVSGVAQVGQSLVGTVGSWSGSAPIGYGEQWLRCNAAGGACVSIGLATGLSYSPVALDVGSTLRLRVSASNGVGGPVTADSAATAIVSSAPVPTPPSNSGLPVVSGVAQVGQSLVGTVGSWSGSAPIGYGEQWLRCNAAGGACVSIGLATGLSYSPVALDVGSTLRLRVSASNGVGGPVTADSAATAVVGAASVVGVSDSFDRADAAALGGSWSATTRYGASSCLLAISGNQAAYPVGRTGTCDQYWLGDSAQADGVASFTVTALPSDGGEFDIQGRMQALGTTSAVIYEAGWVRNTTGLDQYSLYRRTAAGAWIQIVTTTGPDVAVGDQLAFKIQGSTLSVYHRPLSTGTWNQVLTATDTTISGAGRFGIELYNATNGKLDNWTISTDLPGSSPPVPTPPSNSGLPVVSGVAQVGQSLVGTVGSWSGSAPIGYGEQWLRCNAAGGACVSIGLATGLSYSPVALDVGSTLRLRVSASNGVGGPVTADSAATAIVSSAPVPTPPSNSGLPVVSGVAQVGQSLVGTVGSWSGSAPIGYGEQWLRCNAAGGACVSIGLATGLSYSPVALDVGSTLRLRVSASNGVGGPVTADSAATAVVGAASVVGVSDSFDRADAAALGGSWSATTRYGASSCLLAISGNQAAYPVGRTGTCDQYWLGDSAQADGVASFTVTALPSDGGEFDIQGRMQALGTTSAVIYEAGWVRNTSGLDQYSLYRRTAAGAWIQIVTTTGPDVAVGDQLAFKIQGSTLSVYHRPLSTGTWNQVLTATDTTISGAGRFGIELYNATNGKLDNWTISTDLP